MKPHGKLGHTRPSAPEHASEPRQQVLDACAELPLLTGDPAFVRGYVADTVRSIFGLDVAGTLLRDGATFLLDALSGPPEHRIANSSLISQARSFAAQAIERGEILSFRLAGKPGDEKDYHGLVTPLVSAHAAVALVALRSADVAGDKISALRTIAIVVPLSLENTE